MRLGGMNAQGLSILMLFALGGATANAQAAADPAPVADRAPAATVTKAIPMDPVTRSPIAGSAPLLPKPLYPTTDREVSKFTVQFVYNFARYRYTPAVSVEQVSRATASYDTPEQACISFLSSMAAQDYDWWLNNWDADSRRRLEADNQAHHQDPEVWRGAWKRVFTGKRITLDQRLESGPYVVIVYHVDNPADPSASFSHALAFRLFKDNKWLATEELASDNFFLYALQGGSGLEHSGILSPIVSYDPSIYDNAKGQMEFLAEYPKGKDSVTKVVR